MKAAIYSKRGGRKVLEVKDVERPVPREDEVLVRVLAASVNPLDWRMKAKRPGMDVAGEVEAVGNKVTRFKAGDAVFGICRGAFAEYVCGRETSLTLKPESMSFEQAAAVPIAGLTALQGLRDKGRLQPGQKVLINGAAGGVGTFAVQVAKALGAEVTGVCSTKNVERVRELGADCVIDYTREDFAQGSERYDLVLDNVGNRSLAAMRGVLKPGGRCVMVGALKSMRAMFFRVQESLVRSVVLRQNFRFFIAKMRSDDLTTLGAMISAGRVTPVIDRVYPLEAAAEAIAYVEQGHAPGKVIITI